MEIDLKKSSYKKIAKFLSAMQDEGVVIVKQLTKVGMAAVLLSERGRQMTRMSNIRSS